MNMADTVAPKSDQLTADDLLAGPRTITITRASRNESNPDQPVNLWFQGDDGKPYRPCKTDRRMIISMWGPDAQQYVGRSLTLYRNADVVFGGMKVGGIRISHASHLDGAHTLAVTVTRAQKKPYTVKPLTIAKAADDSAEARAVAARGTDAFRAWWSGRSKERNAHLAPILPELKQIASAADAAASDPFAPDPTPSPEEVEARMAQVAAEFAGK